MSQGNWKSWLSFLTGKPRAGIHRPARTNGYRPDVEALENRWVPSASISGFVFIDATGNGLAAGEAGQSNVTVQLYREVDHGGRFDWDIRSVASERTAANGSFAFTKLAAGNYFVSESAPRGFLETAPAASAFYSVDLTANQAVANQDFANFHELNTNVITKVSFTITDPKLGTYTVHDLRGHTHQGDTVVANFTVRGTSSVLVSLVAYNAPSATFNAKTASQDVIATDDSALLSPGAHSLTVQLPDNFYQVDFVLGAPITTFGPAGSNVFYGAQGRRISGDHGGTQAVANGSLSGNVYSDVNGTGTFGSGDSTLAGVAVTLTGTTSLGQSVNVTVVTDSNGNYSFTGLSQGTYTISVTPPSDYTDEVSKSNGSLGGNLGTAGQISSIVLLNGQNGVNYDLPLTQHVVLNPF
jgi:large repetitive protein